MAQGLPKICTGIIARVRGVTLAAAAFGAMFQVPGSASAKTGVALK
jgi:hypothetical protein